MTYNDGVVLAFEAFIFIMVWWAIACIVRWTWHKGAPGLFRGLRSWWRAGAPNEARRH